MAETAAANSVTTVLAGGAGLYLASRLGATGRGQWAAIQSWVGILTILGEAGLTAATCYHVARDSRRASDWMATSLRLLLGLGVITGLVGLGLTNTLAANTGAPRPGFLLAFALMPLLFAAGSWTFALQATDIRNWNIVRTTNAIVYATGLLILGTTGRLSVVSATGVFVSAVTVQALVARGFTRRPLGGGRAQRTQASQLLAYGVRSLAGTAPFAFNARIDQVLLTVLVPSAELGNYAVAVALTLLAAPLATAFGYVIMPDLARLAGDRSLVPTAIRGSFVAGIVVVGPMVALAPLVVVPLLGSSFGDVPLLVALLAPGAVLLGCNQVLGDILRGSGRPFDVARSEAVGLVTTAALLVGLVGSIGARGAAIASTVAYTVSFALLRHQVKRPVAPPPPGPPSHASP